MSRTGALLAATVVVAWGFIPVAPALAQLGPGSLRGNDLPAPPASPAPEPAWYVQALDHSPTPAEDPGAPRTFRQRYYLDSQYARGSDAPVIFFTCGEYACTPDMWAGEPRTLARQFGGHLVALEHRYYGQSQPFARLTAAHLRYLTVANALADLRTFQIWITERAGLRGPWVAVGASYAGSLAAFYRARSPDIVVGAVASSAPVRARADFSSFDRSIAGVAGPACAARMRQATRSIESAEHAPARLADLRAQFEAQGLPDFEDFLFMVADMGALAIQYGYRDHFCDLLGADGENGDPVRGYAQFAREIHASWGRTALSGSVQGALDEDPEIPDGEFATRQWDYQSCTEFGFFQNADPDPTVSVRSARINADYHRRACRRLFGIDAPVPEQRTNADYYWPLLNPAVSRILFTNGDRDPWAPLSISPANGNATNPNLDMLRIPGAAHCDDFAVAAPKDPAALRDARTAIEALVGEWLDRAPVR